MTDALSHIVLTARRFKLPTALNLLGLTAAYMVCYLLLTQVIFQRTYNHGIKDHERIYRLETDFFSNNDVKWSSSATRFMCEAIEQIPQVEGVTMTSYGWGDLDSYKWQFKKDNTEVAYHYTLYNNKGLTNLTDRVIDGSIEWTDDDQEGIIIPASIAKRQFGTVKAVGKQMVHLLADSAETLTVRGVFQDFPDNSLAKNNIAVCVKNLYASTTGNLCFECLVKLKEGTKDVNNLVPEIRQRFLTKASRLLGNDTAELKHWERIFHHLKIQLRPLDDTYFSQSNTNDTGNRDMLSILELIVLLVILVATVNLLIFTLAISPMRVRGTNVRRILGASRNTLRLEFVAETAITSLAACAIALILCHLLSLLPAFNRLFDSNIALNAHWGIVLAMIGIALAVGLVSGIYPAIFTTSYELTIALKGSFGLTPQGHKLRTAFIGLQLVITMFMFAFICTLYQHTRFIYHSDYGYDISQILHVQLTPLESDYRSALRNDLMALEGVENVSYSRFILGSDDYYMSNRMVLGSDSATCVMNVQIFPTDDRYLSTMGIQLVEGRGFKATDPSDKYCIINEAMRDQCKGIKIDEQLSPNEDVIVIGVCKNIRHATTRRNNNSEPILFVNSTDVRSCRFANIRLTRDADHEAIKPMIAQLVEKHSRLVSAPVMDMDSTLQQTYNNEFRFIDLSLLFSVICIIITLVGVFCLTMFEAEYRRKEIGIRKVTGATTGEIIGMFCAQYVTLILVSFVIAAPLAFIIGKKWLNSFAEHRSMGWWVFPLSLLVVGGLTIGTIILQCWRTARENPTDSIKTE